MEKELEPRGKKRKGITAVWLFDREQPKDATHPDYLLCSLETDLLSIFSGITSILATAVFNSQLLSDGSSNLDGDHGRSL